MSSLKLRFAVVTALLIAFAGFGILWFVRGQQVSLAERNVVLHARFVEQSVLRSELSPAVFRAPARDEALHRLDALFGKRVLIEGAIRVKLYGRDGLVVYSNVHSLIGTHADNPADQGRVLAGAAIRDVGWLNHEGGGTLKEKTLEVYVPVRLGGGARADGVFELYQSYAPVAGAVHSFVAPFAAILLMTLLLLWGILFPLLTRMTRALERQRIPPRFPSFHPRTTADPRNPGTQCGKAVRPSPSERRLSSSRPRTGPTRRGLRQAPPTRPRAGRSRRPGA